MHRGFGGTAFEPAEEHGDKELTVGPTMLIVIAAGLIALCGLCFVFGYAVGHRSSGESQVANTQPVAFAPGVTPSGTGQSKPPATQNSFQPQQQAGADVSTAADADPVESVQSADVRSSSSGVPAVRTALLSPPIAASPIPGGGHKVEPAMTQSSELMVQIAAVSHPEDAQVLVGALRKRGYAVTVRRDPLDGLMHVQIGPFTNRNDAVAMRLKLLNDGYNAIVQP